jgi:type III pantothenate kinase
MTTQLLLVVDTGNSDTVFGIFERESLIFQWRTASALQWTSTDYAMFIRSHLLEIGVKMGDITAVVYSSVVPALTPILLQVFEMLFAHKALLIAPTLYDALPIKPINTREIGTDLVANATAAYMRYKQACIVVDFGTALTFTTIDKDGTLIGVAIAPGIKTALNALVQNTAQLPPVPLEVPNTVLGKNTTQALQAGILWGYVGLVKELLAKIKAELKVKHCPVIATGGLAFVMKPLDDIFLEVDVNLTLDGLRLIAQCVQKNGVLPNNF